jgi:hypothetical protein
MMNSSINRPLLVEPGANYFFREMLKQSHHTRMKYHNLFYNIGMFLLLLFVFIGFLVYKYKGKLTEEEQLAKERERQQYILSKIRNYQSAQQKVRGELITGLPEFESETKYVQKSF